MSKQLCIIGEDVHTDTVSSSQIMDRNWSDGTLQHFGGYSIRTRCAAVSELGDGFSNFWEWRLVGIVGFNIRPSWKTLEIIILKNGPNFEFWTASEWRVIETFGHDGQVETNRGLIMPYSFGQKLGALSPSFKVAPPNSLRSWADCQHFGKKLEGVLGDRAS